GLGPEDAPSSPTLKPLFLGTAHRERLAVARKCSDRHRVRAHEGQRVDRRAVDTDFIVQMIAGRTARRADITDDFALLHLLSGMDNVRGHVTVARLDRIAMGDLYIIAITAKTLGAANNAIGGRINGGAVRRGNVDAIVARDATRNRVGAHAVGGG